MSASNFFKNPILSRKKKEKKNEDELKLSIFKYFFKRKLKRKLRLRVTENSCLVNLKHKKIWIEDSLAFLPLHFIFSLKKEYCYKYESDLGSNEHYLSSSEKKA